MTINQAKTKLAKRLLELNVDRHSIIDMTKDESIIEAANVIDNLPDISYEDLRHFIYVPEIVLLYI